MPTLLKTKAIWLNDVVCIPQLGRVRSRKNIPIELWRLCSSPMIAVVGKTFAKEATNLGLTVCIPRFLGIEKEYDIYINCENKDNLYLSMGLNDISRIKEFGKTSCQNFLIDISSGYLPQIPETVKLLVDNTAIKKIILGNVVDTKGYFYLYSIAQKYNLSLIIRCGISNGSGCETYSNTGFGSGNFSEMMEINEIKKECPNSFPASDGGLKDGGYISKAFLSGAEFCFIGGMFAHSLEAETHISGDSSYYGLASDKNQILNQGGKYRHSEGKEYQIDKKQLKPLKEIIDELWGCISSAISFSGYDTLTNAIGNGVFQVKQNSLPPRSR